MDSYLSWIEQLPSRQTVKGSNPFEFTKLKKRNITLSKKGLEFVDKPVDRDIEYKKNTEEIRSNSELYQRVKASGWIEEGSTQSNSKIKRISYRLNSYGFRCDSEFNKKGKGILFLGCSDTFGWAQHKERTWPWLVSNHFNTFCWNLGVPGGSMSTSYRVLKHHIDSVDVDFVCLLSPHSFRSETFFLGDDGKIQKAFVLPNMNFKNYPKFIKENYNRIWSVEDNWELEYSKSLDGISHMCSHRGIQLIEIKNPTNLEYQNEIGKMIEVEQSKDESLRLDSARDGHHAGHLFQSKVSEYFINEIKRRVKK